MHIMRLSNGPTQLLLMIWSMSISSYSCGGRHTPTACQSLAGTT